MTEPSSFNFLAMASECALHIRAEPGAAEQIAEAAIAEVHRIESTYSRYRPDSVLSEINHVALHGGSIEVDAETAALLDYAYACHKTSDGLFDITSGILRHAWDFSGSRLPSPAAIAELLPRIGLDKVRWQAPRLTFSVAGMELDFGGLGKEYAADRAAEICESMGASSALVELGGDVRVVGPLADSEPWTIHLRHPRQPQVASATVQLGRGAIASSGDYERYIEVDGRRYCHILNPKTGWPVRTLASVGIVADTCLLAGSISTIAMLKESEASAWLARLGAPHLWIDSAGLRGGTL